MESKKVTILQGELSFVIYTREPKKSNFQNEQLFHTNDMFVDFPLYIPFAYDFGPPSAAAVYLFTETINDALKKSPVIFYSVLNDPQNMTNAAFLAGAFCIMHLGWSAKKTIKLFSSLEDLFVDFIDASSCPNDYPYGLKIRSCFNALEKSKQLKWIDFGNFDYNEYRFYEQVENGDFNWIIPNKLISFCSPTAVAANTCDTITHDPEYYVQLFKERGIKTVVRLNKIEYDAKDFESKGIDHHDLYFVDGTVPPLGIVFKFLRVMETSPGVAVHCKQGLGRTGTLNACYIMKHYNFTPDEAIAFLRIQRPGSVVGPQQIFLHEVEKILKPSIESPKTTKKRVSEIKNCSKGAAVIPTKKLLCELQSMNPW